MSEPLLATARSLHAVITSGRHVTLSEVRALIDPTRMREDYVQHLLLAWSLSAEIGAPLSSLVARFIAACETDLERQRLVRAATAGARMATRIILALPLGAIFILSALGFNVLGVLFTMPVGWLCLLVAAVLIACAAWWSKRLVVTASQSAVLPGFGYDLVASGVRSGASVRRVLAVIDETALCASECQHVREVVHTSMRWGVPLGNLLDGLALTARQNEDVRVREAIAALGEKVLLPLGLCVLPAFIVLVAVPAVLSTLSATGGLAGMISTG